MLGIHYALQYSQWTILHSPSLITCAKYNTPAMMIFAAWWLQQNLMGSRRLRAFDHTLARRVVRESFYLENPAPFSLVVKKTKFFPEVGRCGLVSIQIVPSSHQANQIPSCCPRAGVIRSTSDCNNTVPHHHFTILIYPLLVMITFWLVEERKSQSVTIWSQPWKVNAYLSANLNLQCPWRPGWKTIPDHNLSLLLSEWYHSFHLV